MLLHELGMLPSDTAFDGESERFVLDLRRLLEDQVDVAMQA
jgi:hypothetical protein